MSEPSEETPSGPGRARVVAAVLAAAVLAAAVAVVVSLTGSDPEPTGDGTRAAGTSAAPTSVVPATAAPSGTAAAGSEPPATEPSGAPSPAAETTGGSADEPPALPAVPLSAPASAGDGVVATLPEVVAIEGSGTGPGNIAGPAVRVTVEVRNGTAETIALDQVAVNAYAGADRTPASPLDDPAQRPFTGSLAPGETATAVQVFSVPTEDLGAVTVELGYRAGAPLLLFTGAVG